MTSQATGTDRYELVDRIATGGMAEVYRAKAFGAHGFEKTLAIKRILPELASEPEFENRFITEAKLAVGLSHANVVQVLDFGRFAGSLFIAMEFVDGLDLARLLRVVADSGQPVPVAAGLQIAIDLCRGLDYAHKHNVVHRDVSPSNILLSRAGEVKIADFGIAQAVVGRGRGDRGWKRIMGKWRYMSPEQTRGEPLTTRSDLFSAASVMFELFAGRKLFPGQEPDVITENIERMTIPSATEGRPELPKRLNDVLASALARKIEDRTPSAAVLLRQLTEISYENALVATPMDVAELVDQALDGEKSAPSSGIDALIRAQISGELAAEETGRQTAVGDAFADEDDHLGADATGSALVASRVDPDGITVWEIDRETIAAVPSALRDGRKSGAQPIIRDHDGREAVARSWRPWLVVGIAALTALVVGGVFWGGRRSQQSAPLAAEDAGSVRASPIDARARSTAKLRIGSRPSGATVFVGRDKLPKTTPTEIEVKPGEPLGLRVELTGHASWTDEGIVVPEGETMRVVATLTPVRATLIVDSSPSGANVLLNGRNVGKTPLNRVDLPAGENQKLVITKTGYHERRQRVSLVPSETASVSVSLRPRVTRGKIDLQIDDGWADVYLRGKRVGRAPVQGLQLPVGRHRLKLVNPPTGRVKWLRVVVTANKRAYYRTRLSPN